MSFMERMQKARSTQKDSKVFSALSKTVHIAAGIAKDAGNVVLDKAAQVAVAVDLDKAIINTNNYLDRKAKEYEAQAKQ